MRKKNAAHALSVLTTYALKRDERTKQMLQATAARPSSKKEADTGKEILIIDTFYKTYGDSTLQQMKIINLDEFDFLLKIVKQASWTHF